MKTRIISGLIFVAIVAAFLSVGLTVFPFAIIILLSVFSAISGYEIIKNVACIENKSVLVTAIVFSAFIPFFNSYIFVGKTSINLSFAVSAFYFIIASFETLKYHKEFSLSKITCFLAMPIVISYAFSTLGLLLLKQNNGLYYLLLLIVFSSMCDMGAYFVGVTVGKTKLCPEISPNKTVEGAIGGVITSIILTLVLVLAFKNSDKLLTTLLLTIPFCIIGMLGDLIASTIKRSCGIKDYGTLIPGHGGVLDRFDSILILAPILYIFSEIGVI